MMKREGGGMEMQSSGGIRGRAKGKGREGENMRQDELS